MKATAGSFRDAGLRHGGIGSKKNPVIKIDFTQVEYRELGLKKSLDQYLLRTAEQHKITLEAETYAGKFLELIRTLGEKSGTVILIDEYDKPIIDYLEASNIEQAEENRGWCPYGVLFKLRVNHSAMKRLIF